MLYLMEYTEITLLHSMFPQYDVELIDILYETYRDVSKCMDKLNDMDKEYDVNLMSKTYKATKKNKQTNNKLNSNLDDIIKLEDISFKQKVYRVLPKIKTKNKYRLLDDNDMEMEPIDN